MSYCEQAVVAKPNDVIKIGQGMITQGEQKIQLPFVAYGNYFVGKGYRVLNTPKKSFSFLDKSVMLFKSLGDYHGLCLSLKETGVAFYVSNNYTKATEFYTEALALANEHNFVNEKSKLNNNIGNLYDRQKNYKKAISYYGEAIRLASSKEATITLLQNIARAKISMGSVDEGLKTYRQSIKVSQEVKDSVGLIAGLSGIASVYWEKEMYDDVLKISFQILKMQRSTTSHVDQIETLNRIGLSYLNLGKTKLAISQFKKVLAMADEIQYQNLHLIHANLALSYEILGDYKNAYLHFNSFKSIEDSLEANGKNRAVEEILAKYEADKQEQKIVLLQREKELQDVTLQKQLSELERSRLTRDIILLVALLVVVLFAVMLILYRQRMQNKIILASKTEEVNRQKTLELIREHELKTIIANIEGRDKERLRISQELHDGVAGSLAGIKLQMRKLSDTYQAPALEKLIRNVDGLYDEVRTISHNLSPHKVLNTAFIDLIRSHLKQVSESSAFSVEFICYPEEQLNKLPDNVKIEVYRIIQELMANILRHAQATAVEVQFTMYEESINLIVEDFGKGFDSARTMFGVGLKSIQTRVTAIKGTLHIESVVGRGTIVNIDIPIKS